MNAVQNKYYRTLFLDTTQSLQILSINVVQNKKEKIEFTDFHTKAHCVRH